MNTIKYRHIVLILAAGGLLTLAMGILLTQPGRAEGLWYVAPGGDDGEACTSPGTACATINGAIGRASSGDTIYVAIGTYTGTGDEVVLLGKDATLSGGWDETFTSQNGTSTIDGEGARRGITVVGNSTATVEYVTIRNGSAEGGGGIENYQGTLILDNSTVSGNSSDWVGGGIYSFAGTLTLHSSTVSGNTADGGGGGISFVGTLILDNSAVSGNRANSGGGGGIHSYAGTLTLNNSTVSGNTANQGGGGISNYLDTLTTLNDSTVSGNIANGNGGGIDNVGVATLILNNSTVSGNSSYYYGGGIYAGGTLTLNNSTISGNSSDREGGGICNGSHATLTLNNSTVSGNSSYGEGGGIFDWEGGTVTLQNTILAGNTAFGVGPDCSGAVGSSGYNLIGDTVNCDFIASTGDLLGVDAGLVPLANLLGYFPLLPDSPAIDAGNPAGCTDDLGSPLDTDQRGASRVGRCDIGAYEYTAPGPTDSIAAVDGTPQHTPPFSAFEMPLRAVLLDSIGSPVDNVSVTFSAPASGVSAIFADSGTYTTTAVTDKGGIAIAAKLTANGLEGSYTVTATASGVVTPASFLLTNIGWYVSTTGDDGDDCRTPATPCATIGGPLGKPSFAPGDTVLVATGTYIGTGAEVVLLDKSVRLLGGWDDTFAMQSGTSIIDADGVRRGMTVNDEVTAIVQSMTIQNGTAGEGGGIANRGNLTLKDCTVSGNRGGGLPASFGGGIVNRGTLNLNGSTVSGNAAEPFWGGGIANYAFLILNNSTVSGNTASRGGGIWSSGSLTLNSSTVSGNMAANDGGGIDNDDGTVTVHNTILAGNMGDSGPDCSGTVGSVGYTLTGDTSGCTFASTTGDLINIEPKLGPLDGSPGYHPLLPSSPAINAGNPAGCTDHLGHPLETDQRGFPRLGTCDMGAYEVPPLAFSTKAVNQPTALVGDPLVYTIVLNNVETMNISDVQVSDTLPITITYSEGSLTATSGSYGYDSGVISWTGSVNAGEAMTIAFGAAVTETAPLGALVTNSAVISGGGEIITRTATFHVGREIYLPIVIRGGG